jgi:hypothetical protein
MRRTTRKTGKPANGGIRALTSRGKETAKGEKDGRMMAARQKALDKEVKKAGGRDSYIKKISKTKSNLVKHDGRYYSKSSAKGKAIMKKKAKK